MEIAAAGGHFTVIPMQFAALKSPSITGVARHSRVLRKSTNRHSSRREICRASGGLGDFFKKNSNDQVSWTTGRGEKEESAFTYAVVFAGGCTKSSTRCIQRKERSMGP